MQHKTTLSSTYNYTAVITFSAPGYHAPARPHLAQTQTQV